MKQFNRPIRPTRLSLSIVSLTVLALALEGCAFFESSGSVSDSFGSVSDSLGSFSDSSKSSSEGETAYREDVRTYTVAHLRAAGSAQTLRLGLSEVALARGISDWEALPGTFIAVGEGLAEVDLSPAQVVAYQTALARPGTSNHAAILEGFQNATRTR
jgi:hypothetical protein